MFKNSLCLVLVLILFCYASSAQTLNLKLQSYCESIANELSSVSKERASSLDEIANEFSSSLKLHSNVKIVFICTHNSRRSHMAELWLHTATRYYGIDSIDTYSGGTESTAFNINAVEALERAGFVFIKSDSLSTQKSFFVSLSPGDKSRFMFSKKYDHDVNPHEDFIAVMVCSEADHGCPVVSGAKARFSLPYNDPRLFDKQAEVKEKYDETCSLIAHEMFYLVSKLKFMANSPR